MNVRNLRRKLLLSMVFAGLVIAALVAYGDAQDIANALRGFRWELTPLILAIAFENYFLRFLKWQYYLRQVGVTGLRGWDSFLIYMSGLGMTITPGKVGEWLKCHLLRDVHGTPVTRSTPILVAERLTDALGLLLLSVGGIIAFERERWPIVAVVMLAAAIAIVVSRHRGITGTLLGLMRRLPFVGRYAPQFDEMSESNYLLMDPLGVFAMTILSVVAWGTQVVAFYLVLVGLGVDAGPETFMKASFILPISTLAAALLLLPGGLGVADAGIASLTLNLLDVSRSTASAATLIIRLATLWFAVILGLVALAIVMRRIAREGAQSEEANVADSRLISSGEPAR
jgi:uncharacterized membrane protein YbhN (UPF0104 family)